MEAGFEYSMLLLFCILIYAGFEINALPYDYTGSIECLAKPHKAQYNGGIIVNPELNKGLKGWTTFGKAQIQLRELQGNQFIVTHSRYQPYDSLSQKLYLQKDTLYTFSAWIQVSEGNIQVDAGFKTTRGFKNAGSIIAESNCWSMLKGGLTVDESGLAYLYFESKNVSSEIWVDSVSLQPFTEKEWKSHQDQTIEKARKRNVKIQAVDAKGNPLINATISIQQKSNGFPFGCAINKNILNNTAYQNWFTSRFKVTTFENEMKWDNIERSQGKVDYSVADSMLQFAKQHNVAVRGHNVFWDDPTFQPWWVKSLLPKQLGLAAFKRVFSIMSKYKGQVIGWDVVNENLHFSFFERRVAQKASSIFYKWAYQADPTATLFMNEYNTIEDSRDLAASPAKYLQKLREIQSFPGQHGRFGIGLEGHFSTPNLPYIRASLDTLAATGLPIWITELDVNSSPNQAWYLEQIIRELRSHPKVNGIVIWGAWSPGGCWRMCLTDNNFRNLPTGNVVDKLLHEWGLNAFISGKTDANGFFETSLFHGDYEVKSSHPLQANNVSSLVFNVSPTTGTTTTTSAQQTKTATPSLCLRA